MNATQEKVTHTPGPWKVRQMQPHYAIESEHRRVTTVQYVVGPNFTALADAYLIAAAPELLRQLKSVLACIESAGECLGDMQGIRDAIAKAEGSSL